jgi:hypothetical protein
MGGATKCIHLFFPSQSTMFATCTYNLQINTYSDIHLGTRIRSECLSAEVQCFDACLENLFRSCMGACMLLEIFVSTTINPKLKDTCRLQPAHRRSERLSAEVQCFDVCLENFIPVVYGCLHASRNICVHHYQPQAKRHASPAAGSLTIGAPIGRGSMLRCLSGEFDSDRIWVHAPRIICVYHYQPQAERHVSPAAGSPTIGATIGRGSMLRCLSGEFYSGRIWVLACS